MRLDNKVALVTGASRGIGRAVAIQFAREGASVVVNTAASARDAQDVANAIHSLGRDPRLLPWYGNLI